MEAIKIAVGAALVTFLALGLIGAGASILSRATCHAKADMMGYDVIWSPLTDCMIKVNNQWIPLRSFKVLQ